MQGSYLGPSFSDSDIRHFLDAHGYVYEYVPDMGKRARMIAGWLASGKVVGCLQGRMEFGPRALGNRSILGDPRSPAMQSLMNLKIKYRESFRPFAPACLESRVTDYFELDRPSPYMLLVGPVNASRRLPAEMDGTCSLRDRIHHARSDVPAITHVDYSARIQTVSAETNPEFARIISEFDNLTGYGIVINTSFNVRGEPIVCTPEDAYRCFMRTEMDNLVLGSFLLEKYRQPPWTETSEWKKDYVLD